MTDKEYYELLRFRVQNENELIHNRMSWFIPLQSFLFISLAIAMGGELGGQYTVGLSIGMSMVGMASAIVTNVSITSAFGAMRRCESLWHASVTESTDRFPPLMGSGYRRSRRAGMLMAWGLPGVIGLFWLAVAFISAAAVIETHLVRLPTSA